MLQTKHFSQNCVMLVYYSHKLYFYLIAPYCSISFHMYHSKFLHLMEILRARLFCNLSLLNFHHSSLKILKFPKPPVWHLNSNPVFNFKNRPKVAVGFHQKKKKKMFVCQTLRPGMWV